MKLYNKYVLIRYNKVKNERSIIIQSDDFEELNVLKLRMLKDLPFQEIEENLYWIDDINESTGKNFKTSPYR